MCSIQYRPYRVEHVNQLGLCSVNHNAKVETNYCIDENNVKPAARKTYLELSEIASKGYENIIVRQFETNHMPTGRNFLKFQYFAAFRVVVYKKSFTALTRIFRLIT